MNKEEIIIGREGDYRVDGQFKRVGRKHARLKREPDGIYIEDLDSANGTFVNGKPVSRRKITASDVIALGGANYCRLNLEEAIKHLPLSDSEFSDGFLRLKKVCDDYRRESSRLKTKDKNVRMYQRNMPAMISAVCSILTTIASASFMNGDTWIAAAATGCIITVVIFIISAGMTGKSSQVKKDRLDEKFKKDYACPSCRESFKEEPWESLKKNGKCPFCQRGWEGATEYGGKKERFDSPGKLMLLEDCDKQWLSDEKTFPLIRGANTFGRKSSNSEMNIQLPTGDHYMGRRHAKIEVIGMPDAAFIHRLSDMDSKNGTFHNKIRLEPGEEKYLTPGDTVRMGHTLFQMITE